MLETVRSFRVPLEERFTLRGVQVPRQNSQHADITGDFYEKEAASWELNYPV